MRKLKHYIKKASILPMNLLAKSYRFLSNGKKGAELSELIKAIPQSNGSTIYKKLDKRVGIVCDEFVYENFKNTCELVDLSVNTWEDELPKLDALIVTSAWRGHNNEWRFNHKPDTRSHSEIIKLCKTAKALSLPLAFYSKEDPPNFEYFSFLAAYCDVIFTSSEECIERYKSLFPEKEVLCLNFAVNPLLHNPIGSTGFAKKKEILFAGSYISKYSNRTNDQAKLFKSIKKYGFKLTIADRNFERNNAKYFFPAKYIRNIVHNFTYEEIARLYKCFEFTANLNSVAESNTMFARRVYDAAASGCCIISNNSIGMKKLFPEVAVSDDEIRNLLSGEYANEISKALTRRVFSYNTVFEEMITILSTLGIECKKIKYPEIAVICDTLTDKAKTAFSMQTYRNTFLFSKDNCPDLKDYDTVALWNGNYDYDEHYLEDAVNAFRYTACDYITFSGEKKFRHCFTETINDINRTVFRTDAFNKELLNTDAGIIIKENGYLL